jgi:peptide/nickel transport system substrate-binding protein
MKHYTLLILLMLAFAGCSREESAPAVAYDGPPKPGGTLTIAIQADGQSLDPHTVTDAGSMRLIENLYSTLMRYKPEYGEIEPDLAERVEISDDGKIYTFALRDNARFHSGRAVTAEDVRYSLDRIREKQVRADPFAVIERIDTPDPRTVRLILREPSAPLLTHLAYPMNAIVDREAVEASNGSLDSADAGSGPFKLVEWRKDNHLKLAKHDGYYVQDRPYLDAITIRPIPDETARSTALRMREVDLVLDLPAKDVPIIERIEHITIESVPGTFWEYIGLNTTRPPFDDTRVRQAVAHAIDRAALNKVIKFGRATVLDGGHIPPNHWAHAADLHPYPQRDLNRAKQLLQEAGHADGFQTTMKVGSSFQYQVDAAQMVKQQLADIGITLELQPLESSLFFDALGKGDFDTTLVGWVGFVDPDEWTYNLFHSTGKYNQQKFTSQDLDSLLERGRRAQDRDERTRIYADAQRLIATQAPVVNLYVNEQNTARLKDVRGFVVHPTATTLSLRDTWLAR